MAYTIRTKDNALDLGRAADQNESVDNDIYFKAEFAKAVGARVSKAAVQSINNASTTTLTFDTESWDTGGVHESITNPSRLTAPTAGKYLVIGQGFWAANTAGIRRIRILQDGATEMAGQGDDTTSAAGWNNDQNVSVIVDLAAAGYVQLTCYQNSGGALDITASFMMWRLGP